MAEARASRRPRRPRASGVLAHPTSLPGGPGIGDLGAGARAFVDYLAAAGQSHWQVLPLGVTGYGDSPYATLSSFAGNPLLISPEDLVAEGLIPADALAESPSFPLDRVDFGSAIPWKWALLRRAHAAYAAGAARHLEAPYAAFREREHAWLDDVALFMTIKDSLGGRPWWEWGELADRRALADPTPGGATVELHRFCQFLFDRQWTALRERARARGVRIVGDLPIYVAADSADVWARPDLFLLGPDFRPTVVAGVPPDYFSATGQLWGNPLYRWEMHERDGFAWWIERTRATLRLVDAMRFDHFRGVLAYWEVPAGAPTAATGRWSPGPGRSLFDALRGALGEVPILVEDLGVITPDVERLRDELGYPGMRVLQFAFGAKADNPYLPHNHDWNSVVYTGTHDNDTTVGWLGHLKLVERQAVLEYLGVGHTDGAWDVIRLALASVARLAIIPLQDVLGLGSAARMNTPGTAAANWTWRCAPALLSDAPVRRLRHLTELYGRVELSPDRPR